MPRQTVIQTSFNGGELSPTVMGRTDMEKYLGKGCESLVNYIPLIQGGITRRPGTYYVCPALGPSRLIPFKYSRTQSYVLEFGNRVLRFYTLGGQIQSGGAPYQISTPYDTSVDNLWDLKFAQTADIMYLVHPNHPPMKLSRLGDANWVLNQPKFRPPPTHDFDQDVGTQKSATLTAGATTGVGVTFTASNPVFIAGDVGKYIVAGTGIAYISAVGGTTAVDPATSATLNTTATADIIDDFQTVGPFATGGWLLRGAPNGFAALGTVFSGHWFNSRTLGPGQRQILWTFATCPMDSDTASNGTGGTSVYAPPAGEDCFRTIDIGSHMLFDGAVLQIHDLTSASQANVELLSVVRVTFPDFQGNQQVQPAASGTWSIETDCFNAANGYPRAVCFFQARLCFAGTLAQPNTIWMSVTNDFENFAKGSQDDDSIDDTIGSGFREQIQWLAAYQGVMAAGTLESEYIISGGAAIVGGNGAAVTPDNISDTIQSRYGVSPIQPIFIDNELLYVQRALLTAYQFSYDIQQSVYASKNLNILHDLITTAGFKEIVYHQMPFRVVWFVDLAGQLVSLTYEREQDVWAWARHSTGDDVHEGFISVCSIPNSQQQPGDDLWCVATRFVSGAWTYAIEVMAPSGFNPDGSNVPLYLDSASHIAFANPFTTITGLGYLEGRKVYITVHDIEGFSVLGPYTVTGGVVDFHRAMPNGITACVVGLNYVSHVQTVRLEIAGGATIQGLLKRWVKAKLRMFQSIGININGTQVSFRTPGDEMTEGLELGTTAFDVEVTNLGYDREGRVVVNQNQPLPSTVLSLFGIVTIGDI